MYDTIIFAYFAIKMETRNTIYRKLTNWAAVIELGFHPQVKKIRELEKENTQDRKIEANSVAKSNNQAYKKPSNWAREGGEGKKYIENILFQHSLTLPSTVIEISWES